MLDLSVSHDHTLHKCLEIVPIIAVLPKYRCELENSLSDQFRVSSSTCRQNMLKNILDVITGLRVATLPAAKLFDLSCAFLELRLTSFIFHV